jgi:hypothetical protein
VTASEGNRIKDCVLLPKSHKIINKGLTKAHGDLIWYQSKYPKFKFNLCYTPFESKDPKFKYAKTYQAYGTSEGNIDFDRIKELTSK